MISDLRIRKARPDDSPMAVGLIYESMGAFGDSALGFNDHALTLRVLDKFYRLPRNRFSHEVSWLAEQDGKIAGILVAFPGWEYWRRQLVIAGQAFRVYGTWNAIRLILRSFSLAGDKETEKDEFYISNLTTGMQFRRQGVGMRLLEQAEILMYGVGLHKCSLVVELDNPGAQALYLNAGFKVIQKVETPQFARKFHTIGYYRMVKAYA